MEGILRIGRMFDCCGKAMNKLSSREEWPWRGSEGRGETVSFLDRIDPPYRKCLAGVPSQGQHWEEIGVRARITYDRNFSTFLRSSPQTIPRRTNGFQTTEVPVLGVQSCDSPNEVLVPGSFLFREKFSPQPRKSPQIPPGKVPTSKTVLSQSIEGGSKANIAVISEENSVLKK